MPALKAPFTWFGGKASAAPLIWERLGDVPHYVEPFCGSLATLLARPGQPGTETVNDADAYICNVWRAIVADPEAVAYWADWPVNEADLHARHLWLRGEGEPLAARCMGDPAYYDPQIAGWWLWGAALWIGSGWCGPSGAGPWTVVDGRLTYAPKSTIGVTKQLPAISHGRAANAAVIRQRPHLTRTQGALSAPIAPWLTALQARLRHVRVCCGDWARVLTAAVLTSHGLAGVLLDPPYGAEAGRDMSLYAQESGTVAAEVHAWCAANGNNPLLRIVLCGYEGEHDALEALGWTVVAWKANGGYGNQGEAAGRINARRERLWCSPHCLDTRQGRLF